MIVLMNGLQSVPVELEEAAKMDGAGRLRVMWRVKVPLMRRSIVLATVFVALAGFLSFDQFYIMTGGAPNDSTITAVYRIYDTGFIQGNLGYAAAMSVALLVVVLVITGLELTLLPKRGEA
jgi:multiple sugar transport system permease protein